MKRAIIIGAGISGLATAWWLHKKFPNIEITILEKSTRVGGLMYTHLHDNFHLDLGPKGFLVKQEGKYTLKLIKDLSLEHLLIFSEATAKNRFVHCRGKTKKISPWTLCRQGLPLAIIKDLFASRYSEDSSVRDFLSRHSSQTLIDNILSPFVTAIRAGHSDILSAHMAFPELSRREAKYGSLIRSFLKEKPSKQQTPGYLATLKPYFGILIDTLARKIPATWRFDCPAKKILCSSSQVQVSSSSETFYADLAIYTGPGHLLPSLIDIPGLSQVVSKTHLWDLSCITLGWNKHIKLPFGYGMLFADEPPLLGIVFNSQVFPKQSPGQTTLSLLVEKRWHEQDAYAFSIATIGTFLGITQPPDVFSLFSPEEGLPQHRVGFLAQRNSVMKNLPKNLKILGQNFYGPGINRCTAAAYQMVASL
ncbi:protoporphyrinogen oxidase [Chlamydia ibidis]|uniref:Coproporphyrinogen III oxidase n=2 Tax=Chlamydia ibidis TaxID=1405396 RepID=S7KJB8_9CHLA|nr:protoporphyrinogen oxidase [Chlamydia ibidis]EPP34520.1 protoporphyrinogen oxidase [Chlamydia ibidis]EQM62468.1 protoporphyrinogen oxidase [Chlamydia ibidis 10-1398/6]